MEDETEEIQNRIRFLILLKKFGLPTLKKLLTERFKLSTGNDWAQQSPENIVSFIKETCDLNSLKPGEKVALLSGDISQWDITVLSFILINMKIPKKHTTEYSNWTIVNEKIDELRKFRNDIEHTQKISNSDFVKHWSSAERIFHAFGVSLEDIDHVRTASRLDGIEFQCTCSNPENEAKAKLLMEEGHEALKSGKTNDAIILYSKALNLSGVPPLLMSDLYCNRSQAYLKGEATEGDRSFSTDERNERISKACDDAKNAMKLSPTSWAGYAQAGYVYKFMGEFAQAINSFEKAITLNPKLQSIKISRDECRFDLNRAYICEHLHPDNLLTNSETLKTRAFGYHEDDQANQMVDCAKIVLNLKDPPPFAYTFMADRYISGDQVPLDKELATALYFKSAREGGIDGIYNVAILFLYGKSVPRDVPLAIELFNTVANAPYEADPACGWFIAAGKYMIGNCYDEGVGLPLNYQLATDFYLDASFAGNGSASHHLGVRYATGQFETQRNLKKAMQFFKLAVEQGNSIVMYTIYKWYSAQGEFDKAEEWFNRSLTSGFAIAVMKQGKVHEKLQTRRCAKKNYQENLPPNLKNLPPQPTMLEFLKSKSSEDFNLLQIYLDDLKKTQSRNKDSVKKSISECKEEICRRASEGWAYSKRILTAMEKLDEAVNLLRQIHSISKVSEDLIEKILELIATACEIADFAGGIPSSLLPIYLEVIQAGYKIQDERTQRNSRVCHSVFPNMSPEESVKFVKVSLQLYPGVPYLFEVLAGSLIFLKKYEEAEDLCRQGLEHFPENYQLMLLRAVNLRNGMPEPKFEKDDFKIYPHVDSCHKAIKAYEDFLLVAPKDHQSVPESCFSIALLYGFLMDFEKMAEFYQKGVENEKHLLSCFLPTKSTAKTRVIRIMEIYLKSKVLGKKVPFKLEEILATAPITPEELRHMETTNPKRVFITRRFRNPKYYSSISYIRMASVSFPFKKAFGQTPEHFLPITFDEMDPVTDKVYNGFFVEATLMEDLIFHTRTNLLHSIVKDKNGDFNRISICKLDQNEDLPRRFGFGNKIIIKNPYFHLLWDFAVEIRVNEPDSIVLLSEGDADSLCRFCWKEKVERRCSRCKRAKYCNRDCQIQDWNLLQHKNVCESTKSFII